MTPVTQDEIEVQAVQAVQAVQSDMRELDNLLESSEGILETLEPALKDAALTAIDTARSRDGRARHG